MNDEPKVEWSYRERLPIHDQMEVVVRSTMRASEQQLALLRRKLRKLQLGS